MLEDESRWQIPRIASSGSFLRPASVAKHELLDAGGRSELYD